MKKVGNFKKKKKKKKAETKMKLNCYNNYGSMGWLVGWRKKKNQKVVGM